MFHVSPIIDWLFPPLCVHCHREGAWLCDRARESIAHFRMEQTSIDAIPTWTLGSYDHPVLGALVRSLKYRGWHGLSSALDTVIAQAIANEAFRVSSSILIPVPLHRRRQLQRGFNQSEIIAKALAQHVHAPIVHVLSRNHYTRPQVGLTAEGRIHNLHNAFQVRKPIAFEGKCGILVDDVVTTGSTIRECANVLRQAGMTRIACIALAKG